MQIFVNEIDSKKYFIVTYEMRALTTLKEAAYFLAIGQSIGNPIFRSKWENESLIAEHACKIITDDVADLERKQTGIVKIAFPTANIDLKTDGISHLLCQSMGGQMDIDIITNCRIIDIKFPPSMLAEFRGPKFGIGGIRMHTNVWNKPLLGGIIKPKVGLHPKILLEVVKKLVDGGVNFIKEDEIMSNPNHCPLEERVPLVMNWLNNNAPNVIYAVCINSDAHCVLDRANSVLAMEGNAIHLNIWSGLGTYKALRELDLPLFLFFQKSGDKVMTSALNQYSIAWPVICKLAALMGVDFIHAGMWGGYMHNVESELNNILNILRTREVMPSLSCGMHPGIVNQITEMFGTEYMATVGGAIHGHPNGTKAGAMAMRQAIDGTFGQEYIHWMEEQS